MTIREKVSNLGQNYKARCKNSAETGCRAVSSSVGMKSVAKHGFSYKKLV